ncbi:MAG: hypothetical protein ABW000_17075 [Actinoplanes sp.]
MGDDLRQRASRWIIVAEHCRGADGLGRFLNTLTGRCVQPLGITAAGLLLVDGSESIQSATGTDEPGRPRSTSR